MLLDLPTFFLQLVLPVLQIWGIFEACQRISSGIWGQLAHVFNGEGACNNSSPGSALAKMRYEYKGRKLCSPSLYNDKCTEDGRSRA